MAKTAVPKATVIANQEVPSLVVKTASYKYTLGDVIYDAPAQVLIVAGCKEDLEQAVLEHTGLPYEKYEWEMGFPGNTNDPDTQYAFITPDIMSGPAALHAISNIAPHLTSGMWIEIEELLTSILF